MQQTRILIVGLFVACLVSSAAAGAGQRAPTPEKERRRVAELATALENEPLAKRAPKDRRKALTIIRNAHDLRVDPCQSLLGELLLSKKLGAPELLVQLQISSAKYLAEHPDMLADPYSVNLAGVEGVLRAYRNMQRTNPVVQIEFLDELVERHANGELGDYVRAMMGECR